MISRAFSAPAQVAGHGAYQVRGAWLRVVESWQSFYNVWKSVRFSGKVREVARKDEKARG